MASVEIELSGDLLIIRAVGKLSFAEITDTFKLHYPKATYHIIWDLTDSSLIDITTDQFKRIPAIAREYLSSRRGGKTAFVSSSVCEYGQLRMYTAFAELANLPYGYNVFKKVEEALEWMKEK